MNLLLPLQLIVFFVIPLLAPRPAAAPAYAAEELTVAELHQALIRPAGRLAAVPGLPSALPRREPWKKDPRDLGVVVSASGAMVLDRDSGAVLFAKDADSERPVASLTKLMTALVFLDTSPDLSKTIEIDPSDHRSGSIEYFISGEKVTLNDLLHASLVGSSNTATIALARSTGLAPEEFVKKMNEKARAIGMSNAVFVEPTGLEEGNRGSASEIAILASAAFANPVIAEAATTGVYTFAPIDAKLKTRRAIKSTDLLLNSLLNQGNYKIAGAKTGTLGEETGYHLAVAVKNSENRSLLTVVLGSESNQARFQDAKALTYWAFDSYEWPR
jgi:D-alanyl-D-alanine carboxypeptidase